MATSEFFNAIECNIAHVARSGIDLLFKAVMIVGSRNQGTNPSSRFDSGISGRHGYKWTRGEPVGCRPNVTTNHCARTQNPRLCGVVWCGEVWCGVVWCGVVWCGVVWCGVVWCGVGGLV